MISGTALFIYSKIYLTGTESEKKTLSFNLFFSVLLFNMTVFLWILFVIGWVTGGVGVSAYLSELMLVLGWTHGLYVVSLKKKETKKE